jgi:hypothetical protein
MTNHDTQPNTHRIHVDVFPALPVCWAALTDTETEEEHQALADWIAWLIDRYTLDHRTVPRCWNRHGALIEELSALRTAWLAAYAITGRPEAPLEWHAHFAFSRHRLADVVARTGCRPGEHRGG